MFCNENEEDLVPDLLSLIPITNLEINQCRAIKINVRLYWDVMYLCMHRSTCQQKKKKKKKKLKVIIIFPF